MQAMKLLMMPVAETASVLLMVKVCWATEQQKHRVVAKSSGTVAISTWA